VQVHCHECHFIGDLIELLAVDRDRSVEETLDDLRELSLVDYEGASRRAYLANSERRQKLMDCLEEWADRLRRNVAGSVKAVLDGANINVPNPDIRALLPHVCVLRKDDFEEAGIELPDTAKSTLSWWKRYVAVGIPCWDGIELVGFWLLTVKGCRYLPVSHEPAIGTGFALLSSFTSEFSVVVDDPVVALRMVFWSQTCNRIPTAFLCTHGFRDNLETCNSGSTVFWSPAGNLQHYLRALNTPGARIVAHTVFRGDMTREVPLRGSWGQFRREIINALPAHQSVAYRLLDTKVDEARPELSRRSIDPNDRAKVLSHVSGDDARHLERIFSSSIRDETISWNGVAITDTEDGWVVRGKIISAAKLYLEQVRPQEGSGDATVTGTITYRSPRGDRHSFPFKDWLSHIKKNPGTWLQQKVLLEAGYHPHVENVWAKKLFEVAQQFHVPTPIMADQMYGWNDGKLRMPNFTVDKNNLYATKSLVEGPGIPLPAPLDQMEWSSFRNTSFCRVLLTLLGNLVRTRHDRRGIGVMLTNEPHMVNRLAQAFGARIWVNPTIEDLDDHYNDPMPLFTEWSNHQLAEVFNKTDGYKNVILSVDKRTARLSRLQPDWLQLSIGEAIDYGALRSIFLLLPAVLRARSLDVGSESFYRDLADVTLPEVSDHCPRPRLTSAAVDLDTHNTYKSSTAATRILELVFYGIEQGDVFPEYGDEAVFVKKSELRQSLASPIIAMPSFMELSSRLRDSRFLINETDSHWAVARMAWDLNASLAGVSQNEG